MKNLSIVAWVISAGMTLAGCQQSGTEQTKTLANNMVPYQEAWSLTFSKLDGHDFSVLAASDKTLHLAGIVPKFDAQAGETTILPVYRSFDRGGNMTTSIISDKIYKTVEYHGASLKDMDALSVFGSAQTVGGEHSDYPVPAAWNFSKGTSLPRATLRNSERTSRWLTDGNSGRGFFTVENIDRVECCYKDILIKNTLFEKGDPVPSHVIENFNVKAAISNVFYNSTPPTLAVIAFGEATQDEYMDDEGVTIFPQPKPGIAAYFFNTDGSQTNEISIPFEGSTGRFDDGFMTPNSLTACGTIDSDDGSGQRATIVSLGFNGDITAERTFDAPSTCESIILIDETRIGVAGSNGGVAWTVVLDAKLNTIWEHKGLLSETSHIVSFEGGDIAFLETTADSPDAKKTTLHYMTYTP